MKILFGGTAHIYRYKILNFNTWKTAVFLQQKHILKEVIQAVLSKWKTMYVYYEKAFMERLHQLKSGMKGRTEN